MSDKFVKNILDVPGVEGVCVFDKDGGLIDNQLPAYFIEDLFDDLARRVISLYDTVDENFIPCDDYLLKYSERWIFLRRGNGIFLLIFAEANVNRVSLKMVTNLAIKNIKSASKGLGATPRAVTPAPAPKAPAEPATPAAEPVPPAAPEEQPVGRKRVARPRPSRSYRGSSY
ncbi:hypothetical protein [Cerasicoccus maritimus]|uniref:hypothetical protein n=1 Tax=Cerasicoccus maritimus TaxID=490089 RepID=UPI002852ADBA|nr:hypothetical protein [Cerasicoccus maritimus]